MWGELQRAAGAMDRRPLPRKAENGVFQRGLNRLPARLALPTDKTSAVVFERKAKAGH